MVYIDRFSEENFSLIKSLYYRIKSIRKLFKPRKPGNSHYQVSEITQFGEEANEFWEKIKTHYSFAFKRDKANLNWRYCDPRSGDFRVFCVLKNNVLLGYCVTSVRELAGIDRGIIVDLCTLPNQVDIISVLLEKAISVLLKEVNMIRYLVIDGHPNVSVFSRYGFYSTPPYLEFRVRTVSEKVKKDIQKYGTMSSDKILLQYGDTDHI